MQGYLPLLIVLGLFLAMIYFLMIRPIKQREKKHDYLVDHMEEGDVVITAGGMFGEIVSMDEHTVVLKVESGATVRVTKGAVIKMEHELENAE
ncbi:MAG: preprotein translocase subunit YajC [Candidatus Aminicenantes bacterium]|nr:preprotein translocase subunit YajC [Candidatus Aminicenantes bacterium]MDH5706132.1 preprotein translocase subunit YajC [Candidatus Aminicenantes bacterium]